jgi:hypothetical protein
MQFPTIVESSFVLPFALRLIMKFLFVFNFVAFGLWTMQAQAESGVHLGQYQKNLKYKGPVTGDEIICALCVLPGS